MTQPLGGVVVVVTRPAAQAARFAAMVTAAGGTTLLLPTVEIEPVRLDPDARAALAPDNFDWTIYTSANAVQSSLRQLPRPQRTQVAAVGRATARALEEHGIAVHAVPRTTADSEGLLELDCFRDVRGRRVLILKGRGGRTLLREELARRGADVALGDVYERRPAAPRPEALAELQRACAARRAVIAATSSEVLAGLLELAPPGDVPHLRDATLLVPGERVATVAHSRGWRGRVIVAAGAEDALMFAALTAGGGSGGSPAAA